MDNFKIKVYNRQHASIEFDADETDFSCATWNPVFKKLLIGVESIYFEGQRLNDIDNEFENTVLNLCEDVLHAIDDPPKYLLFKMKKTSFISDRNLLTKIWNYYEFPSMIFSYSKLDEELFAEVIKGKTPEEATDAVGKILIFYQIQNPDDLVYVISSLDGPDLNTININEI